MVPADNRCYTDRGSELTGSRGLCPRFPVRSITATRFVLSRVACQNRAVDCLPATYRNEEIDALFPAMPVK
jgi:hypothetical protein